ncbi:MAG TPA: beta-propeller fold lactonase family protein [Pseudolabrys sp.]|jgi:DNA-binding beta-propeller fold protein YncE|nr:beta-propeller fold lactonase family protein [Pseudolabrys sp.]
MTSDPNNRSGGPNLIVTCKSADKVQFFDAGTLTQTGEIDMPGSTHELILSPDGETMFGSIYGGGIFGKNTNPDRRIAVIDLANRKLVRTIDVGADVAPHSVMMDSRGTLWSTAELSNSVLAIDLETDKVERIDVGGAAHWIAVSHPAGKLFASFKTKETVCVIDVATRAPIGTIAIPHGAEGIAVSPDGATLFVCAHWKGAVHEIDVATHALRRTHRIEGAPGAINQLRRVRVSPDGQYVCVSSHVDNFVAVYEAGTMRQIAGFQTPKAPMGFGFAADGKHAYLCCHDAAVVLEFGLTSGQISRQFPTAAGCEFIVSYSLSPTA